MRLCLGLLCNNPKIGYKRPYFTYVEGAEACTVVGEISKCLAEVTIVCCVPGG